MVTIGEAYQYAKQRLASLEAFEPKTEAMLLMKAATGKPSSYILANQDKSLTESETEYVNKALARRQGGEPLQYVLGRWEFMSLELIVTKDVLIPRPDTEVLAEAGIKRLPEGGRFLDLCTGSGCLAVSLLYYCPGSSGAAADISAPALEIAMQNAALNGVAGRLELFEADILSEENKLMSMGTFDLIVSNPPYIPKAEIETLDREVKNFEPYIALNGGDDGLDFYRAIAEMSPPLLHRGGWLLFEAGIGEWSKVKEILQKSGFTDIFIEHDLAGIERVVGGRKE